MTSPSDQTQSRDIVAELSNCELPGDIVTVQSTTTLKPSNSSRPIWKIKTYRNDSESRQKATRLAACGAMCAWLSVQRGKSCNYEDFEPYVTVMDVADMYVRKVIHGKLQQDKSDSELTKAMTGKSLSDLLQRRRAAAVFEGEGRDDVETCVAGWTQLERDGGSRESCNKPFEEAAGQSPRATEELSPANGATRLDWNDPGVVSDDE